MPGKTTFKLRAVTSIYCSCRSAMNVYCWSFFKSLFSVICIIKCSLLNIMLHFQAYKHIDIHTHTQPFLKKTITWVKTYILIHVEGVALLTSRNGHLCCGHVTLTFFIKNFLHICKYLIHWAWSINGVHLALLLILLYNGSCGLEICLNPFL